MRQLSGESLNDSPSLTPAAVVDSSQPILSGTGTKNSVFTLMTWGRICALLLYLYLHRKKNRNSC